MRYLLILIIDLIGALNGMPTLFFIGPIVVLGVVPMMIVKVVATMLLLKNITRSMRLKMALISHPIAMLVAPVVAWFLLLVVAILVGNISAWFHGGIHRGISWQLLSKPLIIYDLCCMTVVELLPMIILSFLMSNLIESSISIRIARGTNTTPWRVGLAVLIGNLASWPVLLLLQ